MMIVFSDEEEKYLKYPSKGLPICDELKTPVDVLKTLKQKNKFAVDLVGYPIVIFEK
jgi:hypothetical protein